MSYRTAVIVLSDRAASGVYEDRCLPVVRELLGAPFVIERERILSDDVAPLQAELIDLCDRDRFDLILTSGGTGLSPRDRTPQATAAIIDYEVPGLGEAMRAASAVIVKTALLSRAIAGVRGSTLIINLPGSPKAVRENLSVVLPVLAHALDHLSDTMATQQAHEAPT
ncbi:MAG TPA: MogA/MoaB family molybdenum cofactor biosynthesis protein [Candidatus Baltobacteraceae bacterium]